MKNIRNVLVLLLLTILFVACESKDSNSSTASSISGNVQKGPFKQGSSVKAYKLINGIRSLSDIKSTTTDDNMGSFTLNIPWTGPTEYEISGEYLDENTGNYLDEGLLLAVVDTKANSTSKININIFTHIAASQIKEMLKSSITITEAKQEARDKLKEMFALDLDNNTQLEDLDLTDGIGVHKSDNTQLLKVSAALLSSNNPDTALRKLTEFINPDGEINIDVLNVYNDILEKADEVDLSNVHNILESKIGVSNAPKESTRVGNLAFNHGLSFDTKVDQDINKGLISNYIIINNLNGTSKLSILNGEFSLNDGDFTDVETTVKSTDSIKVKHYSSSAYAKENISTLNIGLSRITFKSITKADPTLNIKTPNGFTFPIKTNASPGGVLTSDEIIVSGLSDGAIAKVGITSGSSYKINDGEWKNNTYDNVLSFSSARNGDIIKVSNKASNSYGEKSVATLTIGGVTGEFIVFTKEKDLQPRLFSPKTVYAAGINTIYETSYFMAADYEGALDIEVINGEVQLEGESTWLTKIPNLPIGYRVKFRQTSSSDYSKSNKTIIKFGKSIINFETITKIDPNITSSVPNEMKFETVFGAKINTFVDSEEKIITGMNKTASYAYVSQGDFISVNGGDWTNQPVEIAAGTKIRLRIKTSFNYDSQNSAHIYHGPNKKLFASFSAYNKKKDIRIDDISFTSKKNAILDTYYESDIVTITGIDAYSNANIINGEYKINGGEWKTSTGSILLYLDNTLQVRHKSSLTANESVSTIVSFDSTQYEFRTKTSNVPQLLNKPLLSVNQNSNYKFIPNVRDSHTLTYSLISNPSWMEINSQTGEINGIPGQSDIGQTDTISLVIKSTSGLERSTDFKVSVNDVNDAPLLSNTWTSQVIDENRNYSKSASAIDVEGGVLTWSISNNPTWLSINAQTGELTGIPRQADVGVIQNIKISVSEEDGLSDSFTFNLRVIDKNSNAQLSVISDKTVNENEELIVQVQASDLDGDVLTFGIQNKPSWMLFNSLTGKLVGTPIQTDVGIYNNIIVSVTDGHGATHFENFKITVLDINETPIITSNDFTKEFILDDNSTNPNNYTFVFNVSDPDNISSSLDVNLNSVITEKRVGFIDKNHSNFRSNTLDCVKGRCVASIGFAFPAIDDFHPSLKTRHTFTVSDGDKTVNNYIDIWYAPTKPVLSGETSHTIDVKDKVSYEAFSFIPTNSGNKARTWSIKNKPLGFDFDTSSGEIKYAPLQKGLFLKDTTFKGIEISAVNDRGESNKFVFSILVKGKPAAPKFTFTNKIGVEIQQWFDSSITVDWLEANKEVSISSNGYIGQARHSGFNVNGEANITKVKNGDKVTVWHKSSNEYDTTLTTTIIIGENSGDFSTKTKEGQYSNLPLIVGAPNTRANANEVYTYIPQLSSDYTKFAPATKPFTIENKPSWATFDTVTGKLSGTPTQVAVHNQVRITAFGDNGLDDITFNITVSNDGPYISGYGHSLENPDLSFTFAENSDWRSKINKVSMYACYDQNEAVILSPSDYTFSDGNLKLHSSTSTNAILHTPIMGGGRLIVEADGYGNSETTIDMVQDGQYAVKANIIEENGKIKVSLSNHLEFIDNTLDISNFSLYQAPNGTVVKSVEYIDNTNAVLELVHTGIANTQDLNIQISINSNEVNICQSVETNTIVVSQLDEVSKNILKTGVINTLKNEDDGFYKKGQNRSYSYTDNKDYHKVDTNIVLDNTTGLQWQNDKLVTSDDYSFLPGDTNWDKALAYCENLELNVPSSSEVLYDDWRLPSIEELLTLVDYSNQDNMLDNMFNHLGSVVGHPEYYYYWSSTAHSSANEFAWLIDLKSGEHHYHGKNSSDNVRCVRGDTLPTNEFTRTLNGVVKDFSTNLLWQDNEVYNSISIEDSISYCQNLNLDNITDWRVPNINELKSILDNSLTPLNISDVFENTSNAFYYSSTHNAVDNTKYWLVGFENDGTEGNRSASNYKTRCVSGSNTQAKPSVELKVLDGSDVDADTDHIKLGIELKGTTFSGINLSLIQLTRSPDKDISASRGFVYVDETHAYIIENMESISEDITVSFTVYNSEINYDENITSNSIIIKK
jgi:hypothetical protein